MLSLRIPEDPHLDLLIKSGVKWRLSTVYCPKAQLMAFFNKVAP